MGFDLHTHSACSDGTDSPAELMRLARETGLSGIAVVDHDTIDGWGECEQRRPDGLAVIRGLELSTHLRVGERRVSIHLLGYLCDPQDGALRAALCRLRADRRDRGLDIVDRMVDDGVPIGREQVLDIAAGAPLGRPHIGRALVAAGLVRSVSEAFSTYLSARGPYYVHKTDLELAGAIALIRDAGGVPVMAHPRSRGAATVTDEAMVRRCADLGLAGLECDHPDHGPADRAELRALAGRLGLIATSASDYHGTNKPIRLGQERSSVEVVTAIVAASSGVTKVLGRDE